MIMQALPYRVRPSLVSEGSAPEGVVDNYPVSKAVSVAKKRRNGWWDKQAGPVADGRWPQLAPIRANINAIRAAKPFTSSVWVHASPRHGPPAPPLPPRNPAPAHTISHPTPPPPQTTIPS